MTTNTEPTTRELVYLAGLLHDIGKFLPDFDTFWKSHPLYADLQQIEPLFVERADSWATAIDAQSDGAGLAVQPLRNLFADIEIDHKIGVNLGDSQLIGAHKLSLDRALFTDPKGDIEELRQAFRVDFGKLPIGSVGVFAESLTHLLRRYTWCLPASGSPAFRSISLFHHLKLTAAFAHCFSAQNLDTTYPVQLLCVDLSGIQSFIYNIGSRYAARSLKGRSFSLQLLLDSIARRIRQETSTYSGHIVYSSGGKFFMLLPNTPTLNSKLGMLQREIADTVWDEYAGQLFVCFGQVAFDYQPGNKQVSMEGKPEASNLSDLWRAVADKAAEQKVRKNSALLLDANKFGDLFTAAGEGGDADVCVVTGQEGKLVLTKDKQSKVHPAVLQQIEIGAQLNGAHYITFGTGTFSLLPNVVGTFSLADTTNFSPDAEYCQLVQPGQPTSFVASTSHRNVVRSFRFFGGSQQAKSCVDDRKPKTFEELAGIVRDNPEKDESPVLDNKSEGKFRQLAVLRMDVDGLGKLFTHGFRADRATFSAYATLSGQLDWFFSGYLNTIRDQDAFRDWVNIIYSGGDDVFAIGRWDRIIAFASTVQTDFKQFTGRPDLTISAGIELMRPRYPIGKAALAAGEAEDRAKEYEAANGQSKNAICLFGLTANWDTEFPQIKGLKDKIVSWLETGQLSMGVLRKLFEYYDIHRQNPDDLSWKWNAAYSLARHRTDKNATAIDALKTMLFIEINDNRLRFDAFAMALRWAELSHRDYPKTDN
ncbi:type III-A CRISPR-associated protein Cas10/Csm1 [Fibrella arboris]|uniref:type III-A CRISPR-associated protein Cas10/Csm1 n=1 Tax=Fibrella arboris TaxID=3242486 RepID=UPI003521EF5A